MNRIPQAHRLNRTARVLGPRRQASTGRQAPALAISAVLISLLLLAAVLSTFATLGTAAAAAWYRSFTEDLPTVSGIGTRDVFKTTRILDRHGNLLYELFNQDEGKRTIVRLGDMPRILIDAVLSVEDASFYDNPGIEPRGIARAMVDNLRAGTVVAGGSTITQQLIRNVLLDPSERTSDTLDRKAKEAFLAMELSRSYSKDQILEWYLNEIYFGNLSYGIGTAARTYFNKTLNELTLPEAALLAGLPQAPSRYDPFVNFAGAKRRQEDVLDLMAHHGYISQAEADNWKAEPLQFTPPEQSGLNISYPHWVFYVRSVLEERYGSRGLLNAGLTVYTTLDPNLQDIAEETVRARIGALRAQNATNASLVAIEPTTGEILAMVGSPDYNDASIDGQVNAAVAMRQPGSSIKPIVYLTAFQKGFSPSTVVEDAPISFPDGIGGTWRPQNFDNRFRGAVTLRSALGNSLNIPAVKVLRFAGLDDTISLAKRMGMISLGDPAHYGLAFTLGGGEVRLVELSAAYSVLANGGAQVPVTPILKVLDADGRTLFEHRPVSQQIVDPRLAYLITDILSDNNARLATFGPNSPLKLANDRPAAAKTGSTDNYIDSWTMGYTPSLVTGVWVGRADNKPMRFVLGSSGAGLIWHDFMERALAGWPIEPFEQPHGMVRNTVCAERNEEGGCVRSVGDWYLEERAPSTLAKIARRSVALDRVTNRLADHDTPYGDIAFRTFRSPQSGEGPFAPTEYSDRSGVSRPWEVLPPTLIATVLPTLTPTPGPSPTSSPGPSPTSTSTVTPSPTRTTTPSPSPTLTPEPTATPVLASGTVLLTSPGQGQIVGGIVPIQGTVTGPDFGAYRVEYISRDSGTLRDARGLLPVVNDQLDEWDTTTIPNGSYTLRLTLLARSGAVLQTTAAVTVANL
ncbi:MAG: penicillin-binding protein, family [Chloroflexi bacterium]|nr:penicillin-binding protein, family [Chloroflexota bacterium]